MSSGNFYYYLYVYPWPEYPDICGKASDWMKQTKFRSSQCTVISNGIYLGSSYLFKKNCAV